MKKHIIILGAGVTGLVCARLALAQGHGVTVIAHEAAQATTSGMSAGMVAPALEALFDRDSKANYAKLRAAQALWRDDLPLWPDSVQRAIMFPSPSQFEWRADDTVDYVARLSDMGVDIVPALATHKGFHGVVVDGEWLFPAATVLNDILADTQNLGAEILHGNVEAISDGRLSLADGQTRIGDAIFLAGGYLNEAIRKSIPLLSDLSPIKGHLLQLPKIMNDGVLRTPFGYLASIESMSVIGASMQVGRGDFDVEQDVVEGLKAKARLLGIAEDTLNQAVPKVGIRAAFIDGMPKLQWVSDHLFVAAGMRRNGFVFAPLAAKTFLQDL